jgi:transposase
MRAAPEEIPDEEHEQVLDRVAAVDVAKDSGMVCTRLPGGAAGGRRTSRVWQVPATTNAVSDLAAQLVDVGVEKVTVESTSDYWRIWYYLFEAAGLDVQLVNARDVKNVPGRSKTDKLDAVWLAKLTEKGMLRPSFVPPAPIRVLRDYTRMRVDLTRDRTRNWQRLEKLLEDALIKVTSVASKLQTLSTRDMVEALIAGRRDPQELAGLARGRLRGKHPALVQALTGRFDAHHGELARILLDQIDRLDIQIAQLTNRIGELVNDIDPAPPAAPPAAPPPAPPESTGDGSQPPATSAMQRLAEIPGLSDETAQLIIAEIGLDMTRFPTAGHLVSWARLCPRTIQSGQAAAPARPVKATHTSKASSAWPPPPPPAAAAPSSPNATDASSNAAAKAKPSSPSPAPSWSSSGTYSPTPAPATTTSAPTTTTDASTPTANSTASSGSLKPSATTSP